MIQTDRKHNKKSDGFIAWGGLQEHQHPRTDGISPTLTAAMGMGGGQTPVFTEIINNVVDMYNRKFRSDECIGTILANGNTGQFNCGTYGVLERGENMGKIGQISSEGNQCGSVYSDDGNMPTLTAGTHGDANYHVCAEYRIRKLTPRECWRLMDFSDEDFEKAASVNSNTQLYRQAGNSICRCVLVAIFSQLGFQGQKRWNEMSNDERNELLNGKRNTN